MLIKLNEHLIFPCHCAALCYIFVIAVSTFSILFMCFLIFFSTFSHMIFSDLLKTVCLKNRWKNDIKNQMACCNGETHILNYLQKSTVYLKEIVTQEQMTIN